MSANPTPAVEPRELDREQIEDVLPSILLLKEVLWTMGSEPSSIDRSEEVFLGLSRLADSIHCELRRVLDAAAAYDEAHAKDAEG
jgi:hypothetical protein